MRLMQAEQSIFIQDLVVVLPTAFHFSPLSKMLCLHQSLAVRCKRKTTDRAIINRPTEEQNIKFETERKK